MAVVEAPVPVLIDDLDIPHMQAHLYTWYTPGPGLRRTHCGIPLARDPHALMHRAEGTYQTIQFQPGETTCPVCGAPLCPVCLSATNH